MKIDCLTASSSVLSSNEHHSLSPLAPSQSSIESLEAGSHKASHTKAFFEDIIGFARNLFFFPFLGHQVLMYQLMFALIFPIILPYIIISEILYIILNIFTCGCLDNLLRPKFQLHDPSSAEKELLRPFVHRYGSSCLSDEHQIRLLHILKTYFQHIDKYASDEAFGKKNAYVQSLVKVSIDGKSHLFDYSPQSNYQEVFRDYLQFIDRYADEKSKISHNFIELDYTYYFGLLKMRTKVDQVHCTPEDQVEEHIGCCGPIMRYFDPVIGNHINKSPQEMNHFALWPGFTRSTICHQINQALSGSELESCQISLIELGHMIKV